MSYKSLKSYQAATTVYDFTVEFCNRYIKPNPTDRSDKSDRSDRSNRSYRTADQMIQAARSGKQNIVEGSTERASQKSEIKLLGVARASLQELLEDYEDFLRQRGLLQWGKESPQAKAVRALAYQSDRTDRTDRTYWSYLSAPEGAANAMICLINQANFLLDRQLKALEQKFVKEGGYTEQLRKKRLEERKRGPNWYPFR